MPRQISGKSNLVRLSGEYVHETELAYLIDFGLEEPIWVPKSVVEVEEKEDGSLEVTMPEKFAFRKGLI